MANQSNDASKGGESTGSTDMSDAFKGLKTQFEAEESGAKPSTTEEEKDEDTIDNDAEADNANDSENSDDQGDQEEDDDAGNGDDDSGDSDKGDTKDKQESGFRFTQIKHDGTEKGYRAALEKEYINSSQEGIKQRERADVLQRKVDAISAAAGKDPEFGEKLISLLKSAGGDASTDQDDKSDFGGKATQASNNPFLVNAETEWNEKNDQSIKEVVEVFPEVLTDQSLNKEVKRLVRVFTNSEYEEKGRLITTGEAMKMALRTLGIEDKTKSEQDLVSGMKKNAAPTRPQAAKKKSSGNGGNTKQFSDLTLTMADRMGITKERLIKGSKR